MWLLDQVHRHMASLPEGGVTGSIHERENLSRALWECLSVVPGVPGEMNP